MAACLVFTAISLVGLPLATKTWHAYAYGVGFGIASGAVALLFFATWLGHSPSNEDRQVTVVAAKMLSIVETLSMSVPSFRAQKTGSIARDAKQTA